MKRTLILALLLMVIVLTVGGAVVIVKKKDTSPDISKSNPAIPGSVLSAQPTNTVDYSGPDIADNTTGGTSEKSTAPAPVSRTPDFDFAITRIALNSSKDEYLFKVTIQGATTGTCTVEAVNGGQRLSDVGEIGLSGNEYSCLSLTLPAQSLTAGQWQIAITVTPAGGSPKIKTTEISI